MPTILRFLLFLILFLWLGICHADRDDKILRIYVLEHTEVGDVLPVIRSILGKEATVEAVENRLVIHTSPSIHEKIEKILHKTDTPKPVLAVEVRQVDSRIVNPSRSFFPARPQAASPSYRLGNAEKTVTQRILVREGSEAFFVRGEEVPYSSELAMVSGRHQGFARKTTYKNIRTGFRIRAFLRGNLADIEIAPFEERTRGSSGTGTDSPPILSYQKSAARVSIPLNTWVELGATEIGADWRNSEGRRWKTGRDFQKSTVWIKIDRLSQQPSR